MSAQTKSEQIYLTTVMLNKFLSFRRENNLISEMNGNEVFYSLFLVSNNL